MNRETMESFENDGAAVTGTTLEIAHDEGSRRWCIDGGAYCEPSASSLVDGQSMVLGSGPDSDVRVSDRSVSARHCSLTVQGGFPIVRDLGSKNGLFVGGARVESARLGAGASFVIGRVVIACTPGTLDPAFEPACDLELPGIVGRSLAIQRVLREVKRFAGVKGPVHLRGETGTGKDVLARALHAIGPRRTKAFVPLNVGTLPRELADAELFGHERGAFTGAHASRPGAFEQAHGGTLFLDEIAELAPDLQVKLLRVLEDGEVRPLGARGTHKVDVRVVSATWAPLYRCVAEGLFRQDLFQRLSVFVIDVPPLRERRSDLPLLCERFLNDLRPEVGRRELSAGALAKLAAHHWPGNVRELRNVLYRAALSTDTFRIGTKEVTDSLEKAAGPQRMALSADQARDLVGRNAGNVSAAARQIGVARSTFRDLLGRPRSRS